ncbi:MAG: hypothetical protein WDN49_11140 [Acetobacteraceae bacterium]
MAPAFRRGQAQPTTTVTVTDMLSPGQQEETIGVYFAGRLAGTLHIDTAHPSDSFTTSIEPAARTDYALCGRLLRAGPGRRGG